MKIKQTLLALTLIMGITVVALAPHSYAAKCAGVKTSVIACDDAVDEGKKVEDTGIWDLLILVINILSAGVGIVAVGGVVWGSILYTTARGSLEQVKKARAVIANTVLGIVAYVLFYAFLNYLIPGGLFK